MSTGWEIKGEAGRALDDTVRSLASINARNATLVLSSLSPDTFDYQLAVADATGSDAILPDPGQIIEVFHNGTRRFRGNVTVPRLRTDRVEIRAEGPWWWWQRIPLTSDVEDDASVEKERPVFVFPTQSLKTSLEALIDRAIANGVPVIRGTVATMFSFPRITLAEKSCGQALADLMSICPDAVAYYDYTGATGTNPTLNIARRADMSAETLTIGTDGVEVIDIYPRLDLEVASVKIGATKRNTTTGANEHVEQTHGTPATGKNQVIVISGPEIGDFLPEDKNNTFQVQSVALPTTGILYKDIALPPTAGNATNPLSGSSNSSPFYTLLADNDPNIIRCRQKEPSVPVRISTGGRHAYAGFGGSGGTGELTGRPEMFGKINVSALRVVVSGTRVPDWARDENGWTVEEAFIDYWVMLYAQAAPSSPPSWYDGVAVEFGASRHQGYIASAYTQYAYGAYWKGRLNVQVISPTYSTLTTIYRAWAYDYIQPPAGLAEALFGAQNWTPHEGRIRTVADEVDGAQALQKKFRLAGGFPAHATMDALARGVRYEIARGRREILLGAPARVDFGSLAARFKRHPKDNIIYL
jgi:hypothetical protein